MKKQKSQGVTSYEFILRKIFLLKSQGLDYETIIGNLKRKKAVIEDLIASGLIDQNYDFNEGMQTVVFRYIYPKEYFAFKELVNELGYNPTLVDVYVDQADLTLSTKQILDLDNFNDYVESHKDELKDIVEYMPVDWEELLTTEEKNCSLYIAHPNEVMKSTYISKVTPDFIEIGDWRVDYNGFINNRQPLKYDDYTNNVYDKLMNERTTLLEKHIVEPRHLAIIEDNEYGRPIIRGIVRLDEQGFMSIDNPFYSKLSQYKNGTQKSKK